MNDRFIITDINRVVMVGENEYSDKTSSFSADLKYNEIIFNFSGQSTVYFDDLVLENKPNTIRFLPAGEFKRYDVTRHEKGTCIFAAFQTDRPIFPCAFVTSVSKNEKLGMLFKKMFTVWVSKNAGYYFEALSILYKIFAELQNDDYVPKQHYLKIKPAIEYIHEHFLDEDLSIGALSNLCGIRESYFQRLFKEKYGMSPKKYIIQLKINHASELLFLERHTVSQIAEMCNFADIYFFSRQFKEYMGLTPTQFIKKYKSSK